MSPLRDWDVVGILFSTTLPSRRDCFVDNFFCGSNSLKAPSAKRSCSICPKPAYCATSALGLIDDLYFLCPLFRGKKRTSILWYFKTKIRTTPKTATCSNHLLHHRPQYLSFLSLCALSPLLVSAKTPCPIRSKPDGEVNRFAKCWKTTPVFAY